VAAVAYSPDGTWITSIHGGLLKAWDSTTGFQIEDKIRAQITEAQRLSFSPDGQHVYTGSYHQVSKWEIQSRNAVTKWPTHPGLYIISLLHALDGRYIAATTQDVSTLQRSLLLWPKQGPEQMELTKYDYGAICTAFSETHLAIGCDDGRILTLHLASRRASEPFAAHCLGVSALAYSPDRRMLASGSQDWTLRIWDVGDDNLVAHGDPLEGHRLMVTHVAFSFDGRQLLSASCDRSIRAWDPSTGQCLWEIFKDAPAPCPINSLVWLPDGSQFASASGGQNIILWNAMTGERSLDPFHPPDNDPDTVKTVSKHLQTIDSIDVSPDGLSLASAGHSGIVCLWNIGTKELSIIPSLDPDDSPDCGLGATPNLYNISYSLDGSLLVVSGDRSDIWMVDVSCPSTMQRIQTPHVSDVAVLSVSPDGTKVATGSNEGEIYIWNTRHESPVLAAVFSPNGLLIASGTNDGYVRVWGTGNG
ncbi:WD40 repeat-like protein, partial [Coniophora puteana RWD-64-598 SS2]